MHVESTIIERVETYVRHPVFAGSDKAMDLIIADLQAMVEGGRIPQATYRKLREMILGGVTRGMLQSMTVPVFMSH